MDYFLISFTNTPKTLQKKLIFACIILLIPLLSACGPVESSPSGTSATGVATLAWTPPTEYSDHSILSDLAGYYVYYGNSTGNYNHRIKVTNPGLTEFVIENLVVNSTYYFAVTAINSTGIESDYSNEVIRTIQ